MCIRDRYQRRVHGDFHATKSLTLQGIEFVEFFIKGQSFLYNQIRKMIGMIILMCHRKLPVSEVARSFTREKVWAPLAPGEGLMLNRVCYDKYNEMKGDTKMDIVLPPEEVRQIDIFKEELLEVIAQQEIESGVFSKWLECVGEDKKEEKKEEISHPEQLFHTHKKLSLIHI
eukprot:TRINITY_DN15148_c0_g1_i2.p1 TRINITY_DN15148_c0_g1~~TRINITY_DN15148_c0_g1_i2.p1  ORF type:complete len:172 (+),score=40.00 TRINITY_DN15148_c0_g1_i2:194-709(+)